MSPVVVVAVVFQVLSGCGGDRKPELEQKYDRLKLDMTAEQVAAIMGEGRPVTAAEVAAYPEHPKLDTAGLPEDTRWVRWGDGYPYVLAGFRKDKLVLAQILGVGSPRRLGR